MALRALPPLRRLFCSERSLLHALKGHGARLGTGSVLLLVMTACVPLAPVTTTPMTQAPSRPYFDLDAHAQMLEPYAKQDWTGCHPLFTPAHPTQKKWCTWHTEEAPPRDATILGQAGGRTFGIQEMEASSPQIPQTFSFLSWSCIEPFERVKDSEAVRTPLRFALAMWTMAYRAKGKFRPVDSQGAPVGTARPSFGVALGDQAYTDPHPRSDEGHEFALSPFTGKRTNQWRPDRQGRALRDENCAGCDRYFSTVYEAYFLMPPMRQTLEHLPTMMLWDDHELRDGFGAQGDEGHPSWVSWYEVARNHYLLWQAARNPGLDPKALAKAPYDSTHFRATVRPGVEFFAFDTRSHAPSPSRTETIAGCLSPVASDDHLPMLGESQRRDFASWLGADASSCAPDAKGTLWIMASSAPLLIKWELALFNYKEETYDDLLDSWGHPCRKASQDFVFEQIKARHHQCPNDRFLVLSGDIHESGLIEMELDGKLIGYEVVSSGLASDIDPFKSSVFGFFKEEVERAWLNPGAGQITSTFSGRLSGSPSFTEIEVNTAPLIPELHITWYPFVSFKGDKGYIANHQVLCNAASATADSPHLVGSQGARNVSYDPSGSGTVFRERLPWDGAKRLSTSPHADALLPSATQVTSHYDRDQMVDTLSEEAVLKLFCSGAQAAALAPARRAR